MITKDIINVGVKDLTIDLFEGQYPVPNGILYNSYLIMDTDIAILDTVDSNFTDEWLGNIYNALDGKLPKYLVVHHVEPDHSGSIAKIIEKYPDITVVANQKALSMLNSFYGIEFKNTVVINNQDTLSLGKHTLKFIFAPMVHWPEVMVSYDEYDKVLFSADAFGTFGDSLDNWEEEASRYYFGIVGKYGLQANKLVAVGKQLEINYICSLHGPVLKDNISYYLDLYDKWTKYEPTKKGVLIACASVYGNTLTACKVLEKFLLSQGKDVELIDLSRIDLSQAVSLAFSYEKLVLASITYNGDVFPSMKDFLSRLVERSYQNRTVGFIENGSWGPVASKVMKSSIEGLKNITVIEDVVTIKSGVKQEDVAKIEELAKVL